MFFIKIIRILCGLFLFCIMFISSNKVLGLYKLKDIKIDKYYLSSTTPFQYRQSSDGRGQEIDKNAPEFSFKIVYKDDIYNAFIKPRKADVVFENKSLLTIYVDSNKTYTESLDDYKRLYEGYILERPHNSSLNGYIKNRSFCGHVLIDYDLYYIDEVRNIMNYISIDSPDDLSKEFGQRLKIRLFSGIFYGVRQMASEYDVKKAFLKWKQKGMLCSLMVVIDNSFLTVLCGGNREAAIYQTLMSIEEANAIFRSTDFDDDGESDNIGCYVKDMVIVESENTPYFIMKHQWKPRNINDFFFTFAKYKELSKYCLGILFTAQSFKKKVLGVSFTPGLFPGGICDRTKSDMRYNTIVVTTMTTRGKPVPQIVLDTTVAHEIGHSFGSLHDSITDPNCFGYLMSPETFDDYELKKHIMFSPCSKKQILRTLMQKGHCFEPVTSSFCGNAILEDNEECDCGVTLDCLQRDPCCVSRRTREHPCKVNRKQGFECHPSQGECCSNMCTYAKNIPNVDCTNFDRECPCPEQQTKCSCGINSRCINDQCHSLECTRLNLVECDCQQDKLNGCQICCKMNNDCMPSVQASRHLLISDSSANTFNRLLEQRDENEIKLGSRETFCRQDKKSCLHLYFSRGNVGEYCLRRGKLGRCNQNFVCDSSQNKQSFPVLTSLGMPLKTKFPIGNFLCVTLYTYVGKYILVD